MAEDILQQLIDNYQPADNLEEVLRDVSLIGVIGPAAAGKSTLMNLACQADPSLHRVLSHTDRAPRAGETTDQGRLFLSREEARRYVAQHKFLQIKPSPKGDIYGTLISSYPKSGIAMMDIWASAVEQFMGLPFKEIRMAYIVPASFEMWKRQFDQQALTPSQRQERWAEAKDSLIYGLSAEHIYFVLNDDLPAATQRLLQVAHGLVPQDNDRAKQIAQSLLKQLD